MARTKTKKRQVDELAQTVWDYHHLNQKLKKAGAIMVLGSHDLRVAEYGIELFKKGYAPLIIFSGGLAHQDDLLNTGWEKSEAETMADLAVKNGVPAENIIIENQSQNTGDNFRFTKKLLEEKSTVCKSFIFVQKPYMERRVWATFKIEWPDKKGIVASPPISFEDYCNEDFPKDKVINIMLGDLQRIKIYARMGFQKPQRIPSKVWQAYQDLLKLGYNKHLLKRLK